MKIADLKQPYKRMAEYLAEKNANPHYNNNKVLKKAFSWAHTNYPFWDKVNEGECPQITEEIKKNFPADFDFSGEDIKTKPVMQMLDTETQKRIYTQLAKEGKFDELPDTCEFSEAVELEVWDDVISSEKNNHHTRLVIGKFKNKFIASTSTGYCSWNYAQLPTPKIDFSQFKSGDVVEVETISVGYMYGYIREVESDKLLLSLGYMSDVLRTIRKEKIKSITKIK